jgi:hypothetical protein
LDLQEPSFAWPTSYENDEYPTSNRQVDRHQEPTTHESYQSWSEDDSTLVNSVVGRNSREYENQGRFETYNDPSGRNSYRDSYQQSDRRTRQYDDHDRESTVRPRQYDDHDRESTVRPRQYDDHDRESTVRPRQYDDHHRESTVRPHQYDDHNRESTVRPRQYDDHDRESTVRPRQYDDHDRESTARPRQYDDHDRESTARPRQYDDHDRESTASRNSGHSYASRGQKQAREPFKIMPPKEPNPLSMQSQETPHGALIDIALDPVIMQALKQLELSDRDREVVRKHGQKGNE